MDSAEIADYECLVPLALVSLSMGYIFWKKRLAIEKFQTMRKTEWPPVRVIVLVTLFAILGMIGTYGLIKSTGVSFSSIIGLSAKRTVNASDNGGDEYAHAGYLRWVAQCSKVAFLLLYMAWGSQKNSAGQPRKFGFIRTVALAFLAFSCSVWPIISSSRSAVVETVFAITVIYIYERNGGSVTRFIRVGSACLVFALTVLVVMGLWRNLSQRGEVAQAPFAQTFADQTLGSGNFMPAERTAFIMAHYGGKEYMYGSSYLTWLAEPIPKSIWPDRPDISDMASFVKGEIYQRQVLQAGYPPGMMGEAFINFGYVGLIVVPFFIGCLLRFVYLTFRPLLGVNKNATLLYAAILWQIGLQIIDLDFSLVMLNAVTTILPLLLAFSFMKKPSQRLVRL